MEMMHLSCLYIHIILPKIKNIKRCVESTDVHNVSRDEKWFAFVWNKRSCTPMLTSTGIIRRHQDTNHFFLLDTRGEQDTETRACQLCVSDKIHAFHKTWPYCGISQLLNFSSNGRAVLKFSTSLSGLLWTVIVCMQQEQLAFLPCQPGNEPNALGAVRCPISLAYQRSGRVLSHMGFAHWNLGSNPLGKGSCVRDALWAMTQPLE